MTGWDDPGSDPLADIQAALLSEQWWCIHRHDWLCHQPIDELGRVPCTRCGGQVTIILTRRAWDEAIRKQLEAIR